jgi:hypothetical protein
MEQGTWSGFADLWCYFLYDLEVCLEKRTTFLAVSLGIASSDDDNRCVFAVMVNTCVVIRMVGGVVRDTGTSVGHLVQCMLYCSVSDVEAVLCTLSLHLPIVCTTCLLCIPPSSCYHRETTTYREVPSTGGKQSRMCEIDGLTLRFLPVNVTPPLNLPRSGNCDPLWSRLYITVSRRITPCHLGIVYLVQPLAFRGAGNAMLA